MTFHRFEDIEDIDLTPHLSSGRAPIIEGKYLYFCLNQKEAGTGSELHYHPNELLIFVITGKVNALVGKERRVIPTGTFVLIPPNVRHSMKATEDGPCAYLYIKDQTWTVVGIAEDEAPPERALTMEESAELVRSGRTSVKTTRNKSEAIIEGVPNCFYPMVNSLDEPLRSGQRIEWIEGEREAMGFYELNKQYSESHDASPHEQFLYMVSGKASVTINGESRTLSQGDIGQITKGSPYSIKVGPNDNARFLIVRSTEWLERVIDEKSK